MKRKYSHASLSCRALILGSAIVLGAGCAPSFEGTYDDPERAEIIDDRWNETDANKVAQHMVAATLKAGWLTDFKKSHGGKKPIVIVTDVENRTDEHIDTKALTDAIRAELINSRRIRFVNKAKRAELLEELKYQNSGAVSANSRKSIGKQIGAGYFFGGGISSQVHTRGGLKTVTYQVDLNLTSIETAEIEWVGHKKVKKRFNRSGSKF